MGIGTRATGAGRVSKRSAAVAELLEPRRLLAATVQLPADVNAQPVPRTNPHAETAVGTELTRVGGRVFFRAADLEAGMELWRSDGTQAGTVRVKDIVPGRIDSSPANLTDVNGTLFFTADDGVDGVELWKSDGTAAGTVLVRDIRPGAAGSYPDGLTNVNGTLYFTAYNEATGGELWKSDGTAAGTVVVRDIRPGAAGSAPTNLVNVGGVVYFTADDNAAGHELWRSNGTAAGTALVLDIRPGTAGSSPSNLTALNGQLFFTANDGTSGAELWRSNGTATGTARVRDIYAGASGSSPANLTDVNGTLFFAASNGASGIELFKSDGTEAGTVLVKDLFPGSDGLFGANSSLPRTLTAVNGQLYFEAGARESGLWRSDGTEAGTTEVGDNQVVGNRLLVHGAGGGTVLFAGGGTDGAELWRSDGTAGGTTQVRNIHPTASSNPTELVSVGGTAFFIAEDGTTGACLWKTDGTGSGTVLVRDIDPRTAGADPTRLLAANAAGGGVYFVAEYGGHRPGLWRTAATGATTLLFAVPSAVTTYDALNPLGDVNGAMLFAADDGVNGTELWRTDGTPAGTRLLKDINPGTEGGLFGRPLSSVPRNPAVVNGVLYFTAGDAAGGAELWRSDGTEAGTVLVKDIRPGTASSLPADLVAWGNTLYFTADDGAAGRELWRSDGTATGTVIVADAAPGAATSSPTALRVANGRLYFAATNGTAGVEPWSSDGTAGGTAMLLDVRPGSSGSAPADFTAANGLVFFAASGFAGRELWATNGTTSGTRLVKDIYDGTRASEPSLLTAMGGVLYFRAADEANGPELWRSDGTPAGTALVRDINTGSNPFGGVGSGITNLTTLGGLLYFNADGTAGAELWQSDGTTGGTVLAHDLFPGKSGTTINSSAPAGLMTAGGSLYFTATDGLRGRELWRLDPGGGTAPATVAGRYVFYNNSGYDGNTTAAATQDDGAIDTGKVALLSGAPAAANATSYAKGINGVMIDVADLPAGNLLISDVSIRSTSEAAPNTWAAGPAPLSISVRPNAGVNGSTRVTLIWNDFNPASNPASEAVANGWLEVTLLANARTGLAAPSKFAFGNLVGDADGSRGVNLGDFGALRQDFGRSGLSIANGRADFNRDRAVNLADFGVLRGNFGKSLSSPPALSPVVGRAAASPSFVASLLAADADGEA